MTYELALPRAVPAFHDFSATVLEQMRRDLIIYVMIAVYVIGVVGLCLMTDNWAQATFYPYFRRWPKMFLITMPLIALGFDAMRVIIRVDEHRRLAFSRVYTAERFGRLAAGMALLMALMMFQGAFTTMKNMLPALQGGFSYDVTHANIDEALHFGYAPWALLHGALGDGFMRTLIDWNYNVLWFGLCFGGLFYVATVKRCAPFRLRYMLMFMVAWVVVGNVLAGTFLSAGPAFYAQVTGDSQRFTPLVASLGGDVPTVAARYQTLLWRVYQEGRAGFASGISAFPSVHVSLITINALFLAERLPKLRLLAAAYVAIIIMSSVYLGWHYAIDGYVAVLVVVSIHLALKKWFAGRAGSEAQRQENLS